MEIQVLKEKLREKLERVDTKTLDDGTVIYSPIPKDGKRTLALGYFSSEEEALQAFYDYLVENKKI